MIDSKDLRIGNYMQREDGSIFKVDANDIKIISEWKNPFAPLPSPIPLNVHLIESFLFKKIYNQYQFGWYMEVQDRVLCWCHSDTISLEFKPTQCDIYDNTLFDFKCEYVHQLQNLFYSLTGKELELTKQ